MESREALVYIAGLFDGEGCISVLRGKPKWPGDYETVVTITNGDKLVLQWINEVLGGDGRIIQKKYATFKEHWKPAYDLRWTDTKAERILRALLPFLKIKHGQALTALQFRETYHLGWTKSSKTKEQIEQRTKRYERFRLVRSGG